MRRAYGIGAIGLVAALTLMCNQVVNARTNSGQTQPPPTLKEAPYKGITSVQGKDTFAAYCAVCHGADAKGHGPAAPALAKPVPDLRLIASRHDGKFDPLAVHTMIYGRDRMPPAHGTVDMPMWGPVFEEGDISSHTATLRMKNLLDYLRSIQQK